MYPDHSESNRSLISGTLAVHAPVCTRIPFIQQAVARQSANHAVIGVRVSKQGRKDGRASRFTVSGTSEKKL